jgi:hypothetical protein
MRIRTTGDAPIHSRDITCEDNGCRPVVVIDPEDREQVERLLRGYAGWKADPDDITNYPEYVDHMQAALREFANPTPPRPEEPTGLGPVVEAPNGDRWSRIEPTGDPDHTRVWICEADEQVRPRPWPDIAAVRVLSEGVQAGESA